MLLVAALLFLLVLCNLLIFFCFVYLALATIALKNKVIRFEKLHLHTRYVCGKRVNQLELRCYGKTLLPYFCHDSQICSMDFQVCSIDESHSGATGCSSKFYDNLLHKAMEAIE